MPWRIERSRIAGVPSRRPSEARRDVPSGNQEALAVSLRRLLIGGRATGRCTLMSGLSFVLKGIANTKALADAV